MTIAVETTLLSVMQRTQGLVGGLLGMSCSESLYDAREKCFQGLGHCPQVELVSSGGQYGVEDKDIMTHAYKSACS